MTQIIEPISETIWDIKYRYRLHDKIIDKTIADTWQRVAKAIARVEKVSERSKWQQKFYDILNDYQFLPGGRILAGAGTKHRVTLLNCFVMDIKEDSLRGIFDALEECALTLQQGGGVGYDFSVLRPNGDIAEKTGIPSSGPVSFMKIWDTTCGILLSTGARRGAMMGVMRCDHPDIEEFVAAKKDPTMLRHFNVSVMVNDAFMQAVKDDAEWPLIFPLDNPRVYKKINARELWNKIIRSAYDYAEPGVLFADTINRNNNLWYREQIHATNPCGEIPLPRYGACDLGAINLTKFVSAPFTEHAQFNWEKLIATTQVATRFLDNVLDASHYPLKIQKQEALGTRRIGLGLTGLADTFVMLGMQYGSVESIALACEIIKKISYYTWSTSIELAKEKGKFPYYDQQYLRGEFVQTLDPELQTMLQQHGIRNSHHNTIAPAGTISLFANNISNGIEPIFAAKYDRNMIALDNSKQTFQVKDYAYHLWVHEKRDGMPRAWVDTSNLSPQAHLEIQAVMQPFIDNAISKTINIPQNFPLQDVIDVYSQAYTMGLKGCTIFRPNPVTGSVLSVSDEQRITEPCCQRD